MKKGTIVLNSFLMLLSIAVFSKESSNIPSIYDIWYQGQDGPIYNISSDLGVEADAVNADDATFIWSVSGGTLTGNSRKETWNLPSSPGLYTISVTATNASGSTSFSKDIIIKDKNDTSTDITPIVYYSFNGNTLNSAQDALHATNHGTTPTTDSHDEDNSAYKFSSKSEYISTAFDNALNTPYVAIALWVRLDEASLEREQYVISQGSWDGRFKMSISSESNKLRFTIKSAGGIRDVEDYTPLEVGKYTHYTAIYNGYAAELYRDGVLVNFSKLEGEMGTTNDLLVLGREKADDSDRYFVGAIDEVRIYKRDLPPYYVSQLPSLFEIKDPTTIDETLFDDKKISVYPTTITQGEPIYLNTNIEDEALNGSEIKIYSLVGQCIKNIPILETTTTLDIPTSGCYVLKFLSPKGIQKEFKVIVK